MTSNQDKFLIKNAFQQFCHTTNNIKIEKLTGGLSSSELYKCALNNKVYVAKILNTELENRKNEIVAQIEAANIKIAPQVYYHDPEYRIMIMDYMNYRSVSLNEMRNNFLLDAVVETVTKLNKLPTTTSRKSDIIQEIQERYAYLITTNNNLDAEMNSVISYVDSFETIVSSCPKILSHGDINPRNIFVKDENVILIDWETAGIMPKFFDLAYFSMMCCLDENSDLHILSKYLGHPVDTKNFKIFKIMKLLARASDLFYLLYRLHQQNFNFNSKISDFKDFEYYQRVFADDNHEESQEFLFAATLSQLNRFLQDVNNLD